MALAALGAHQSPRQRHSPPPTLNVDGAHRPRCLQVSSPMTLTALGARHHGAHRRWHSLPSVLIADGAHRSTRRWCSPPCRPSSTALAALIAHRRRLSPVSPPMALIADNSHFSSPTALTGLAAYDAHRSHHLDAHH
ncbi:unnamed protein product [Linum trigynum]|uniref:Uncharacterized protein n=1 Tax=Linum trigynum TaxID=586398 RepID=A0AAV2CF64_9ROSI